MRKKIIVWAAAVTLCLTALTACRSTQQTPGEYLLYFPVSRDVSYGAALGTQRWEGGDPPDPRELLEVLLDGPTQEGLRSPFPGAVTLQFAELYEEEKLLRITLSEQYGGLADMAQTLADACIVMTVCQHPDVDQVEISSDGFWASRPASRILSPAELELDSLLP